jgi:hypothetical protein
MGETCSTYGRYEKLTQNFGLKTSWEETTWKTSHEWEVDIKMAVM